MLGDGGKLSEDSTTIVWANLPTGQVGEGLTVLAATGDDLNLGSAEPMKMVSAWLSKASESMPLRWAMVKISPLLLWSKARRWGIRLKSLTWLPAWQSRRKRARASNAQTADEDAVATITIQEGFAAGIMTGIQARAAIMADETVQPNIDPVAAVPAEAGDTVLVSFRGIPEGVSVMVPDAVGLAVDADRHFSR